MKHYVVYSHGFGVRKDDRGLFSDISNSLDEAQNILFDYNQINEIDNTLTVSPLNKQVLQLKEQIDKLGNDSIIDVIAHSQGCVVAAIAKPSNIRKMIFIAPPDKILVDRIISYFGGRDGAQIDLENESIVPRRDGSTTIIPSSYWDSIKSLDVINAYNHIPETVDVRLYIARSDEVLGMTNFDSVNRPIELKEIDGNHDFTGTDRPKLLAEIKQDLKLN